MKGHFNVREHLLYQDHHFLAVNKPAGISSLDPRSSAEPGLLHLIKKHFPEARLCHRLDKDTSGVLLVALDAQAHSHASVQFEKRSVEKVYHALVDGRRDFNDLTVDLPIAQSNSRHVRIDRHQGKDALTVFNTLELFRDHTLLECRPKTGRMHQIRIHLATQRTSIAGDEKYGGQWPYLSRFKKNFRTGRGTEERPMIQRMALHAYRLTFKDLDGTPHTVTAPYPKDFEVLVQQLRKFASV